MIVNDIGTSSLNGTYVSTTESNDATSDLGIDDFFTLMTAQLQNQSIDSTVDNTEYISQMAQFSTLSVMSELKDTIQSSMAVSLIGKTVSVTQNNSSEVSKTVTGEVEQISYYDGEPYVYVNGGFYKLADIIGISNS